VFFVLFVFLFTLLFVRGGIRPKESRRCRVAFHQKKPVCRLFGSLVGRGVNRYLNFLRLQLLSFTVILLFRFIVRIESAAARGIFQVKIVNWEQRII
jgi:hypothetical protein